MLNIRGFFNAHVTCNIGTRPLISDNFRCAHAQTCRLTCSADSASHVPECGPMPNVMAALPNIGGALCESSVISFLVPRRKLWLTPTARVSCSKGANIGERKTRTQSEFCSWQTSVRGKEPQEIYITYQPRRRPNIVHLADLH